MRPARRRGVAWMILALMAAGAHAVRARAAAGAPAAPAGTAHGPELTVYAAASLRDALQEMESACAKATGTRLVFNFGASNDLARQIEAGNKADLFFSADTVSMDRLAGAGLVDAGSRRSPLSNRLVVVVPADSPLSIGAARDLLSAGITRLSVANPEAVPAGTYARAWLEKAGVWDGVKDRLLPGLDVRAALAAVESGGAQAGIVYRTDAAASSKVRIALEVPDAEGPRIAYALAALRDRPALEASRRVAEWLAGPEAAEIFTRHGFVVPAR